MSDAHTQANLFTTIVLAAGKGTRMKSPLPKVLHSICGWPILRHVCAEIKSAGSQSVIVVVNDEIFPVLNELEWLRDSSTKFVIQKNQKGTGDAVASCASVFGHTLPEYARCTLPEEFSVPHDSYLLICAGDCPAICFTSIKDFVVTCQDNGADIGLLGIRLPNPFGYGRIITENGMVQRIVEEKDATQDEKNINLCNSGFICGKSRIIFELLKTLTPKNAQAEYYLTDIFAAAAQANLKCHLYEHPKAEEWRGVNDPWQLAQLEVMMVETLAAKWAKEGVRFTLPQTVYIEKQVYIEKDAEISPHVILRGNTHLGAGCYIGPSCVLNNVRVKKGVRIAPFKHLYDCEIEQDIE